MVIRVLFAPKLITETDMDVYEALYTTRAMRRVRPDPVGADIQARILDAAIRAPSGGNAQNWHFLLVDDPAVKAELGPLYRDSTDQLWKHVYADRIAEAQADPTHPDSIQFEKVRRSAQHLADHFEEVPLYLFGFVQHDPTGGSIFPAVWSAQLAARAEGIGSALDGTARVLPWARSQRRAAGAGGSRLDHGVLRVLRLPHGPMGGGAAPSCARSGDP